MVDLEKYAGWLGRGIQAGRVREDVAALIAAIHTRAADADVNGAIDTVERDMARVEPGEILGILSRAVQRLRAVLADSTAPGTAPTSGGGLREATARAAR